MDQEENVDQPIYDLENVPAELARVRALRMSVPRPARTRRTVESFPATEGHLAVDIYETPSDLVVESAVAGVDPEDIDISATTNSVTIKGERRRISEVRHDNYLQEECWWGRFSRTVALPHEVDPHRAVVRFRSGILTIRLPKTDFKSPRKLRVSRGE